MLIIVMKENVNGIILILCCEKYRFSRFEKFKLPKNSYENWKVIYVFANLFLDKEYNLNKDILTVKTEDSYFHLTKKLILSLKYLYEIYNIKEGILRCGDDLEFNENNLIKFLKTKNKDDFIGINKEEKSELNPNIYKNYPIIEDYFMFVYYKKNQEDINNPNHNLKYINFLKYIRRPKLSNIIAGTLFYISNKSSKILIDQFQKINCNILHFDKLTESYPYIIEDCSVSFILYLNKIKSTYNSNFVNPRQYNLIKDKNKYIACHTQYYQYHLDGEFFILNYSDNKYMIKKIFKTNNKFLLLRKEKSQKTIDNLKKLIIFNDDIKVILLNSKKILNFNNNLKLIKLNEKKLSKYNLNHIDVIIINKNILKFFLNNKNIININYIINRCFKHQFNLLINY